MIFLLAPHFPSARAQDTNKASVPGSPPELLDAIKENDDENRERQEAIRKSSNDPSTRCSLRLLEDFAIDLALEGAAHATDAVLGFVNDEVLSELPWVGGALSSSLGFLGIGSDEEKVRDSTLRREAEGDRVRACIRSISSNWKDVIFEDSRKRLVDQWVDETMEWVVNGGKGSPKWYENFGRFVQNAGNAAVGDIALDLGLADFCTPFQAREAELQIIGDDRVPEFSERISCTAADIWANGSEAFNHMFTTNNGWKNYFQLLEPQNNRYGLSLLLYDEAVTRIEEEQEAARLEILANQGFTSEKQCVSWDIYNKSDNDRVAYDIDRTTLELYNSSEYILRCREEKVLFPGRTTAAIFDTALSADAEYAGDLSVTERYLTGLFDSGMRRTVRWASDGLFGPLGKIEAEYDDELELPIVLGEEKDTEADGLALGAPSYISRTGRGIYSLETPSERAEEIFNDSSLTEEEQIVQLQRIYRDTQQSADNLALLDTASILRDSIRLDAETASSSLSYSLQLIEEARNLNTQLVELIGDEAGDGLLACQQRVLDNRRCGVTQETLERAQSLLGGDEFFDTHIERINDVLLADLNRILGSLEDASEDALASLSSTLDRILSETDSILEIYSAFRGQALHDIDAVKTELDICLGVDPGVLYVCPPAHIIEDGAVDEDGGD